MKLYITVNRPIPSSYVGIDLSKQQVNFDDMDSICEAAECNEIILDELTSYVAAERLGSLLQQIVSRLRKGGKMIVKDVDVSEATKMYQNGMLNINDLNFLLFGKGQVNKCGAYSLFDIKGVLESLGLESVSVELDTCYYTLVVQRI